MKKLQLVTGIFCLAILFSSCAHNYHLALEGHYKPNTDVAKSQVTTPASPSEKKVIEPIAVQNKNEAIASANETEPDLNLLQPSLNPQVPAITLTQKQEQKLDKKLEKISVKIEKRVAQNGKQIQQLAQSTSHSAKNLKSSEGDQLLSAIISIFIPFLGVALYEQGITSHFWIDLILTILFYVPGLIYALIIILG